MSFIRSVNPFAPLANGYKPPSKASKNKTVAKTVAKIVAKIVVEEKEEEDVFSLKERLEKLRCDEAMQKKEVLPRMGELKKLRIEQTKQCTAGSKCADELKIHLDVCPFEPKCIENRVAYECRYKENGRCSHYYEIKHLEEQIENYEYYIDEAEDRRIDLEIEYEVALAKKEGRYDEYKERLYEEFD